MARIQFSELVDSITGKIGGTVFQNSYGGYQVRTRQSPRNPRSGYQQLRRGNFGANSANWRNLSGSDRTTWIDAAGSPGAALNLFNSCNTNMSLINEPLLTAFTDNPVPDPFIMSIIDLAPDAFDIWCLDTLNVVPDDTTLLIYTTYQKFNTHLFINKTQFSPIITFPSGTDMNMLRSILTEFANRFSTPIPAKLIYLQSTLVSTINGLAGVPSIDSAIVGSG